MKINSCWYQLYFHISCNKPIYFHVLSTVVVSAFGSLYRFHQRVRWSSWVQQPPWRCHWVFHVQGIELNASTCWVFQQVMLEYYIILISHEASICPINIPLISQSYPIKSLYHPIKLLWNPMKTWENLSPHGQRTGQLAVRQRDVFLLSHLLEVLPFASRWGRCGVFGWVR